MYLHCTEASNLIQRAGQGDPATALPYCKDFALCLLSQEEPEIVRAAFQKRDSQPPKCWCHKHSLQHYLFL